MNSGKGSGKTIRNFLALCIVFLVAAGGAFAQAGRGSINGTVTDPSGAVVPATKVLFLSAHNDEAYIVGAVNAGAMGYLIKQTSADCVCAAIREVQKGNTFFSPSIPKRLHKRNREK